MTTKDFIENPELPADALVMVTPVRIDIPLREDDGVLDVRQRVWDVWATETLASARHGQVVILRNLKLD